MTLIQRTAVVVFSGGQDSTTCLYWAKNKFAKLCALSFDYGQRHKVELECARKICEAEQIPQTVLQISSLKELSANALVDTRVPMQQEGGVNNLPSTFVPGRNALFLTLAAAYALPLKITDIVIGACEADYSGYPDCRDDFVRSMEKSLSLAMDSSLNIHTPLMFLNKAQCFSLAQNLGCLDKIIEHTHTCYYGDRQRRHDWGYGCGDCPACELRAKGYRAFIEDFHYGEKSAQGESYA